MGKWGVGFEKLARELFRRAGFQFGGSALAALLHDVFLLTGIFSIMGKVFDLRIGEIDTLFVTAVLTVVGFSVHDTIVVFDRVRENLRVSQRLSFEQVVNLSIMQTAARSIITSFTVVLVLAAILISGGDTLKAGTAMFCGTFAVHGDISYSGTFDMELEDPVLGRELTHGYKIVSLPDEG